MNYTATQNVDAPRRWFYSKTDHVEQFVSEVIEMSPDEPFVLVTGNSDYPINADRATLLDRYPIAYWFAINVKHKDPRLIPIPIGIKNEGTPKQGCYTMRKVMDIHMEKTVNVVANFNISTNPIERTACLSATGVKFEPWKSYEDYLKDIYRSRFTLAPNGNGMDTHRAWDALYLRSVPVVTRSLLWDSLPDFPAVVLDSWEDFKPGMLTEDLYHEKVAGFDFDSLYIYRWLDRMDEQIGVTK
jgi:hypothetical protein